MSLPSWDATPWACHPSQARTVTLPAPQTWGDTPAAAVRWALGLPVADETAERFAAELDERWEARRRFREAWDMPREDDTRRVDMLNRLAAEQRQRGQDWLSLRDGEETVILRRLRALQESQRCASSAVVTGPNEPNPLRDEALRRIAAGNGGAWSPVVRGVAGPT